MISDYTTLAEIKALFFGKIRGGDSTNCPCCGRYAQVYKRSIHRSLVEFLYALRREQTHRNLGLVDSDGFVDVPALLKKFRAARDFCLLKHWGLIAAKANVDAKKRTSGRYIVTPLGESFLRAEIRLPKHLFIFDDRVEGRSKETVNVAEAYGEGFDYAKLVGGIA